MNVIEVRTEGMQLALIFSSLYFLPNGFRMQIWPDFVGRLAFPPFVPRSPKFSLGRALSGNLFRQQKKRQSGINYGGMQEVPLIPLSARARYVVGFKRNVRCSEMATGY